MTRDEIKREVMAIPNHNILLQLSTGVGKTSLALSLVARQLLQTPEHLRKVLIVYPKNVLVNDWKAEMKKWHYEWMLPYITFTNYASLHKHATEGNKVIEYTATCWDECHHLSAAKRELAKNYHSNYNILLSATIGRDLLWELKSLFPNLYVYKIGIKTAIEEDILPEPTIVRIPLRLSMFNLPQQWIINPKATKVCPRKYPLNKNTYWYLKKCDRHTQYIMEGTTTEYMNLQNSLIEFYKSRQGNIRMRNIWLQMCGTRLHWLAMLKNNVVLRILKLLDDEKTLTFCSNIEQAELLSPNAIHSGNDKAMELKNAFNEGKIKHISSINILSEGANLTECKYGIWARYNASEIAIFQKQGRILRHKKPVMILPYFMNTREEELVNKMCEGNGTTKIITLDINNINRIKAL